MKTFCFLLVAFQFVASAGASTNLSEWLSAQAKIKTWSADFTQTRTLKALVEPLKAKGRVWFAAPDRFRWELADQTIAVKSTNEMLLIYPKLKRVERYPLSNGASGSWRDMLSLLEAGFPRSEEELQAQFRILKITASGDDCEILLQPKSAQARRFIRELLMAFDQKALSLRGTELRFADGSALRNDFTNEQINAPLDEKLFQPQLDPSYKTVEPLRK